MNRCNHPAHNLRKQYGQSLIILLLAVLLIGLILAGALYEYRKTHTTTVVNQATNNVTAVIGATQKLYRNGYSAISLTDMINNGVFPTNMAPAGATAVTDAFGGAVTVGTGTLASGADSAALTYAGIPSDGCSDFVQNVSSNVPKIEVNGTQVQDTTAGAGGALSVASLGTACQTSPATIIFTFGH